MIDRYRRIRTEDSGFTLIELFVVVLIIGILAAIATAVFLKQRGSAYNAALKSDLDNAALAQEAYLADSGGYSSQSPIGVQLIGEGFHYSASTDYASATAAIAVTVDGNRGYCLTASSSSGDRLVYDSERGGLQPVNGACSF